MPKAGRKKFMFAYDKSQFILAKIVYAEYSPKFWKETANVNRNFIFVKYPYTVTKSKVWLCS